MSNAFSEDVEMQGHIIDSLLLPKVLDEINSFGADFRIVEIRVGHGRHDPSHARLTVSAPTAEVLERVLTAISLHGATAVDQEDCKLVPADMNGAFPEGFYCSTNEDTEVRIAGEWVKVDLQEMDCGIVVDPSGPSARCLPMSDVKVGEMVVIGRLGTRVHPVQRDATQGSAFGFMNSTVSSEKPKNVTVRDIAKAMHAARGGEGKILIVAGPAVVHTGSRDLFRHLVEHDYVQVLFAGNALATHDIEQSFYGTSLGISMEHGRPAEEGHEHHLRSINRIRRLGSISQAVDAGVLTAGIMHEVVKRGIPFVLAGSIRDDGPLPDVITDTIAAQRENARTG